MPRGRTLKTKVREAEQISKAIEKGIQKGNIQAHEGKEIPQSLKEHIGKMIDRIDPTESIALIGATILVHETIARTETLLSSPRILVISGLGSLAGLIASWTGNLEIPQETVTTDNWSSSITGWLISFAIAYFLIKNPQIINSALSLVQFLGLMLLA